MLETWQSVRVTVMGLGRFGGGSGVVRWLAEQGAQVLLTDVQARDDLADPLQSISDLIDDDSVSLRLGGHQIEDFTTADLVVANPAVTRPWDNEYLQAAAAANVPVTTEIRLLVEQLDRKRVIGVTGTAGKSTTVAMIHHILMRLGVRARLGGNIGGSLLRAVGNAASDEWFVLELSSFMLHWLGQGVGCTNAPGWSPHVAVITNIEPNHLDWHGTVDHYRTCKQNIARYQDDDDHLVTAADVSDDAVSLRVPGQHNQANARLAIEVVRRVLDVSEDEAAAALRDFGGLPHRLQLVAERRGMSFYNDSKSTTPAATALAVGAFNDPSRVHLIAGGFDKGSDMSPIAELAPQLAGLYTIGATGTAIARAAAAKSMLCDTLDRAVAAAMQRMRTGDVLLLSPGCASWDQFVNYEQRGETYVRLVETALREAAHPRNAASDVSVDATACGPGAAQASTAGRPGL